MQPQLSFRAATEPFANSSTEVVEYLSDLRLVTVNNSLGPVERNRNNGTAGAGDGGVITLNGATYAKGLGVYANSELHYCLGGTYTRFLADIGVDDAVAPHGTIEFQVWADGVQLFKSSVLTNDSQTRNVEVNLTGKYELVLITVTEDGESNDVADWANARLIPAEDPPLVGARNSSVFLSDLKLNFIANGLGPVEKDKNNGREAENDGGPLQLKGSNLRKAWASMRRQKCAFAFVVLTERLGVEALNLGSGGASPTFHNSNSLLMRHINNATLVIVQVLSGRSQSNSMFRLTHHGMEGERVSDGLRMTAEEFFEWLLETAPESVPSIVKETRENYVRDMYRLLQDIGPPKILFWFSVRPPEYVEEYTLPVWKLWSAFPQFVNREMIDEIKTYADEYVECVTDRGLPQPLFTKDGKPALVTHSYNLVKEKVTVESYNRYYPSPEMHEEAALLLEPACRKLLYVRSGK